MKRDIAKFNERITIQKNSVAIDGYQNHKNVWEDYFSCYAYASTYGAQEKESEIVTEERSIIFEVRYCSELSGITSTGYRILFHGDVYGIESVDMMNYQRKTIKLHSRKERP
ncbi:MAG: hypothetical protein BACD_00143 [Bacteroides rodentium]